MRKLLFLLVLTLIVSCDDNGFNNRNPYLPNYNFSFDINTNLPAYSNLQFASNYIKIYPSNGPSSGVIVFNTGSAYNAFDGGCPNQDLSSCSILTLSGINATCPCDDASYSLFTGQAAGKKYPLKQYRVEINGQNIRVYN
ncbi:hypothetical protein [Flavobacterium sp.]|uniref:Rieske (2Fe-2S) protein n=1 Tax=Flavobacterium sp. TaxID=239 RepID=UPI002638D324|nr:hypothetical protein [Flavobacterium sp.]